MGTRVPTSSPLTAPPALPDPPRDRPRIPQVWAQWWILWRRIAGGLDEAQQAQQRHLAAPNVLVDLDQLLLHLGHVGLRRRALLVVRERDVNGTRPWVHGYVLRPVERNASDVVGGGLHLALGILVHKFSKTLFSGRGKKVGNGSLTEYARNSALQRLRSDSDT